MLNGNDVCTRAKYLVTDPDGVRWTADECVLWLNDGLKELVRLRPDSCIARRDLQLVPGVEQVLPENCVKLLDVLGSMNARGMNGPVPSPVSRSALDMIVPMWMQTRGTGFVIDYCYTASDPRRLFVYPRQPDPPGMMTVLYYAVPPTVLLGDPLPVRDDFIAPLANYLLFRMYSKDAEFAANLQVAQVYYTAFEHTAAAVD